MRAEVLGSRDCSALSNKDGDAPRAKSEKIRCAPGFGKNHNREKQGTTEEKSALVVTTGEGWSTVLKRLQCFEQQRQRCSLSKKREDKMCSWVRQEPQQREARNTSNYSQECVGSHDG